jgi:hypothetical protein
MEALPEKKTAPVVRGEGVGGAESALLAGILMRTHVEASRATG